MARSLTDMKGLFHGSDEVAEFSALGHRTEMVRGRARRWTLVHPGVWGYVSVEVEHLQCSECGHTIRRVPAPGWRGSLGKTIPGGPLFAPCPGGEPRSEEPEPQPGPGAGSREKT